MFTQLAVLALIYAFIADLVIAYERVRTKTPETDKTYLGLVTFNCLPKLAGWGWLFYALGGLLKYVVLFIIISTTLTFISSLIDYFRDRKRQKA